MNKTELDLEKFDFGLLTHHMTVKSELSEKLDEGEITKEEAERIYRKWLKERKEKIESVTE